ncbi:MAG: DHHA1 domain-containing protein, partial [Pirellulaceae bacterium]
DKKPCLRTDDIGFTIGPRLNAAGRLGQAQLGVELLTTDSPERAKVLAEYLHSLNSDRDTLERTIRKAAVKQAEEEFDPEKDPALVLAGHGWHPGVIGIVAGRLAEKYHRPVIVVALDQMKIKPGTGSGRSAAGLNLHQALAACSRHLIRHGGHAAAAGLTIEESSLDAFRADFCEYTAEQVNPVEQVPEVTIDAESQLSELTLNTLEQIEQLAPFGAANPRPILCASEVEVVGPKRMGGGGRHMTVSFQQHGVKLRAVAFGQGDWTEELDQLTGPIDIAYRPVINEFRGRRTVEMQLVDWRPAQLPATVAHD